MIGEGWPVDKGAVFPLELAVGRDAELPRV